MAYLKPPAFVRWIFNPLLKWFGINGAVTLVVRGRKSGHEQAIPVRTLEFDGATYLVSTYGQAQWVLNLRAANGKAQLRRGGESRAINVTEVEVGESQPLIDEYVRKSPGVVRAYFKKLPDAVDHPVFRVEYLQA